jgi:hypothetical protein
LGSCVPPASGFILTLGLIKFMLYTSYAMILMVLIYNLYGLVLVKGSFIDSSVLINTANSAILISILYFLSSIPDLFSLCCFSFPCYDPGILCSFGPSVFLRDKAKGPSGRITREERSKP